MLARLNLLIPCLVLAAILAFFLAAFIGFGLQAIGLGSELSLAIAFALSFVIFLGLFIRLRRRRAFVPIAPDSTREARYRIGHGVLATINVLLATSVAVPVILATAFSNPEMANLLWFAVGIFVLAIGAWPIGLYMVWTSKS